MQQKNAFDLVIANILAGPLKEMAGEIKTAANRGGHIILSGMLKDQVDDVLKFYCTAHCTIKQTVLRGDWVAVLLAMD
jgi:ribosomal protein L11 methyltransferase